MSKWGNQWRYCWSYETKLTTNSLRQWLGKWIDTHVHIVNVGNCYPIKIPTDDFMHKEVMKNAAWKIYEHTNNVTQIKWIDKASKYKPTKYNVPVQVHASVKAKVIYIYIYIYRIRSRIRDIQRGII